MSGGCPRSKVPVFFCQFLSVYLRANIRGTLTGLFGGLGKKTNWVQKDLLQSKNSGANIKREANA